MRNVRRKMSSTPKRIIMAAVAVLALTVAPAQSKTRNLSINEEQQEKQQQKYEIARKTIQTVGPVPSDVIDSTDPNLIDFVIAGFPKCGTTYLQNKIFYESEKVFIPHSETHYLANDRYEEFKNEFANVNNTQVVGYKSPFELGHQKSLRNLQALFPDIKMIITMRHPILEFQSLYNYELRKMPELIPPVEEFVGICREQCLYSSSGGMEPIATQNSSGRCLENANFCTGQTSFHQFLSRLGLTPMNTTEELDLLDHHHMSIHPFPAWRKNLNDEKTSDNNQQSSFLRSPNQQSVEPKRREDAIESKTKNIGKLFLIEIGQLDDSGDETMADQLNSDLEQFLGLERGDLARIPYQARQYDFPPGREEHKIDICQERYHPLREVLLETSRKASKWILRYLLHPSNRDVVVVSNMEVFVKMLEGWNSDPCSNEDENSQ